MGRDLPIVGAWKLRSFLREVTATGEQYDQLGEHPESYLLDRREGIGLLVWQEVK